MDRAGQTTATRVFPALRRQVPEGVAVEYIVASFLQIGVPDKLVRIQRRLFNQFTGAEKICSAINKPETTAMPTLSSSI